MTTLLHIDASARIERSISRDMSRRFVERWRHVQPNVDVIRRDVGQTPPSFVTQTWIAACFTRENERTAQHRAALQQSDELIAELDCANVIVIGTPMYNYGLPAALKAWVDQVIRVNKTFSFDLARGDYPLEPIMTGKTLVCLTSKGEFGFDAGGIREHANHLDPHVRTFAHYLGAADTHFVNVEYQEFGDERHETSRAIAEEEVLVLSERLARKAAEAGLAA